MRKGRTVKLVPDKATSLISNLCPEEEARALALADIALHNSPPQNPLPAGERAKMEHRSLMEQLDRAARKARGANRAA
jgi:hypothetical protein